MARETPSARVSSGIIWIAIVLLVGVLSPGIGYFQDQTIPLFAGLLITLGGVLGAVVRLVRRGAL